MNIVGEVFKKRPYANEENQNMSWLLFLNVYDGIVLGGDRINTIPMIISNEGSNYQVGDRVEIKGEIEYRRITTPAGNLSFSHIPVIIPKTY